MTEYSATEQPAAEAEPEVDARTGAAPSSYTDPEFAARYGVRPGMSRMRKITLGVVGLCGLGLVVGYIAWNQSHPEVQASVLSYTTTNQSITVTFEVDKPSDAIVECTLQALDVHGEVVGSANVPVAAGRSKEDLQATVNTTGTPNTVEVSNCVKG